MSEQKVLFDSDSRKIVPAENRLQPSIWIRELRVLRELRNEPDYIVRSIQLHRGLNILWAREPEVHSNNTLFQDTLSGHSAGKTTFCRFLRHVLGEPHFGDEQLRQDIRRHFPNGWITAQVYVAGCSWAVFRPIRIGDHPFAMSNSTIDQALQSESSRETFDTYLSAINSAVLGEVPMKKLGVTGEILEWSHLLPWIARDQDCHFDSITEWRETSSDSGSPQLDTDERQFLLRAVLDLISDDEDKERVANDRRNKRRTSFNRQKPILLHQSKTDRKRLEEAIGKPLPPFDNGLFRNEVDEEIASIEQKRIVALNRNGSVCTEQEVSEFEEEFQSALKAESDLSGQITALDSQLTLNRKALESLEGKITNQNRKNLIGQLGPSTGFCNALIDDAIAAKCPLAASRTISFTENAAERGIDDEASRQKQVVESLVNQIAAKRVSLLPLTFTREKAQVDLRAARSRYAAYIGSKAEITAFLNSMRQFAKNAEQAWKDADDLERKVEKLKKDIKTSYKRQVKIREKKVRGIAAFSLRFHHFISALLGENVEGVVQFSGREIKLKVIHRGERRSSAIRIVATLAFDLTALTGGIEDHGFHPRLLIHDGPRESDMAVGLYRKVFFLAEFLESCKDEKGVPCFQYIITTTEAPPEKLQDEKWLLDPVLDAADPSKRFLRVDL